MDAMTLLYMPDNKKESSQKRDFTLSKEAQEFIMVKLTGWKLEYIRSLSTKDYQVFALASMLHEKMQGIKDMIKLQSPSMF